MAPHPQTVAVRTVEEDAAHDTPVVKAVRATPPCYMQPYHFFVSWQGVLTIAYGGLPPALETLKGTLAQLHPSLPTENPGSRWPKTTLGCLADKQRLGRDQLATLIDVCKSCTERLLPPLPSVSSSAITSSAVPAPALSLRGNNSISSSLLIDSASVVLYECRSLERCIARSHIPFTGSGAASEEEEVPPGQQQGQQGGLQQRQQLPDDRLPRAEQVDNVRRVVAEWDAPDYWFQASRDGNREAHYRGNAIGATLVHWLDPSHGGDAVRALLAAVAEFRSKVEEVLPGMYAWFDEQALHITLRNLKD